MSTAVNRTHPRSCGNPGSVTRDVHVPNVVEKDEDGIWIAAAEFRPGVGAVGDGATPEAAIAVGCLTAQSRNPNSS
jgi:hypothetical protein